MPSVSLWAMKLDLSSVISLWWRTRFTGRVRLRFTEATPVVWFLFALLRKVSPMVKGSRCLPFTGHGEHVDGADSEVFDIQAEKNEFALEFSKRNRPMWKSVLALLPEIEWNKIEANFRSSAATTYYDLLEFVSFAKYWEKRDPSGPQSVWVLSPHSALAKMGPRGSVTKDVVFVESWHWRQSLFARFGLVVQRFFRDSWRPQRERSTGPARVGTTLHFQGMDRGVALNDVHWFWDSGLDPGRVVLCFEHHGCPATPSQVDRIRRQGFNCVAFNKTAAGKVPGLLWRPAPGILRSFHQAVRRVQFLIWGIRHGVVGRWSACRLVDTVIRAEELAEFNKEFNVRAFFHFQDGDIDHATWGCEISGAARVGDQWSNHHWPSQGHVRQHHVYFTWGSHYAKIIRQLDSCVGHLLPGGCLFRDAHPGGVPRTERCRVRNFVERPGVDRVLTLFDTSLPCEEFYRFFLTRVINDGRWGLLIKSKRPGDLPWVGTYAPAILPLFAKAVGTGRVALLDWTISPAAAGLAADVCVGVDMNTATVVSALAGARALHLDYVGFDKNIFREWAYFHLARPDRLMFRSPQALWTVLDRFFQEGMKMPKDFGQAEEAILKEIDFFRDGRASERIGTYVFWYLKEIDRGMERDEALVTATSQYMERWGGPSMSADGKWGVHQGPTTAVSI